MILHLIRHAQIAPGANPHGHHQPPVRGELSAEKWAERLRQQYALEYFGFGHPWDREDLDTLHSVEGSQEGLEAYYNDPSPDVRRLLRPDRFPEWAARHSTDGFICGIDLETPKVRYGHLWWLSWRPLHAPWHDYDQPWGHWESRVPIRVTGASLPQEIYPYWKDPSLAKLLYPLIHGKFLYPYPDLKPGQVPWEAFAYDVWREALAAGRLSPSPPCDGTKD